MRILVRLALALSAIAIGITPALADKRVALVIGNGAYQNDAALPNAIWDAAAIAAMFREAGFDNVIARQDLGNRDFKRALREFGDAARDADVAVVYYAGHGIQVRDMNYMIPVDARLATEIDAEDEAVSLDRILAALKPARRLRLVILDACRNNLFARTMKRRVAMRAIVGGLGRAEPTLGDTLISYAAKAGSTSEEGSGQNSPFAAALLRNLLVPGLDIRLALSRVRNEVLAATGYRQEPVVYGAVQGRIVSLAPLPAGIVVTPAGAHKRVALVIGNGAYQHAPHLENPIRDATAIAAMFRQAGFDQVIARRDVGGGEFRRALQEFGEAASDADIAVIYYAGHGMAAGKNYMIPVDARLATAFDAQGEAISIDRILAAAAPARRLRLIILDACRDNPFVGAMNRRTPARTAARGLAPAWQTVGDTLISYAAKPGSISEEGEGEHSPFASALLRHLLVPGLDVRHALGRIRHDVLYATVFRQEPLVYGSMQGKIVSLAPTPAERDPALLAGARRDFDLARQINSKRAWEIFIRTHKAGPLVEAAWDEIRKLDEAE